MALLVIVMQTAGLAHRIQHGDAAVPGLTAVMALANGASAGVTDSEVSDASVVASGILSSHFHFGHSCVLFDGDALFVGGAVFISSLEPLRVSLAAPRFIAGVSPDLAPLRTFLSRAPPRDIRSALA